MGKNEKKIAGKGKSKKIGKDKKQEESSSTLGPSTIRDADLDDLVKSKAITGRNVVIRPVGEANPSPRPGYTLVFEDFFEVGFGFPCSPFLIEVLKLFGLEFSQLNSNGLVRVAIFEWIVRSCGGIPHGQDFAYFHTPRYYTKQNSMFGCINFWPRLNRGCPWPAVSSIRTKWSNKWQSKWFYLQVPADL